MPISTREQIAFQMSDMNDTPAGWTHIEPLLDEAMQSLDATDRTAILLHYFETSSYRKLVKLLARVKTPPKNASAAPSTVCATHLAPF